jgi:hypothetical protein
MKLRSIESQKAIKQLAKHLYEDNGPGSVHELANIFELDYDHCDHES